VDVYDTGYYYPSYYGGYTTVYTAPPVEHVYEETIVYPENTVVYPEDSAVVIPQRTTTLVPEAAEVVTPEQVGDSEVVEGLNEEAVMWVDRGIQAFAEGKYDESRDFYVRAIFADDQDGIAKLLYGLANIALGDFELASTSLRRATEDTPELVDNPIDLRGFYPNEEALNAHVAMLDHRLAEQPDDREALFLLGYLQYATGNPASALEKLERLMALDGNDQLAIRLRDAAQQHVAVPVTNP